MNIDEYLKQAAPKDKKTSSNIYGGDISSLDDYIKKSAPKAGYTPPVIVEEVKPVIQPAPEEPSKLNKTFNYIGKGIKAVTYDLSPFMPNNYFSKKVDEITQPMVDLIFNTPAGEKITKTTQEETSNLPLKLVSVIESASPNVTYKEAIDSWEKSSQDPNNPIWKKFAYNLQSSGTQSLLGVVLSFIPYAGKPLASTYFAAISAESQREDNQGKVVSPGNIAIDVVGDRILGDSLQGLFKTGKKTLLKTIKDSALTEGSTEVMQTLLKYGNDYKNAKTPEQRESIISKAKEYVTSGNILMEFGVGATAGGAIGAGTNLISKGKAETPTVNIEEKKYTIEKSLPIVAQNPNDEHLIETVKQLAEETGDTEIIQKVDEAIAKAEENAVKLEEQSTKLDEYIEQAQQTPEKELTEPSFVPYKPARVIPADRVYTNTPTGKFIIGEFEGKPYTSDSYIMEFNSDVQPPKKVVNVFTGDQTPTSDAIKKLMPADENLQKVEITKVAQTEDGKSKIITLEGDGLSLEMQQKYFDYFSKKYPGATFKAEANNKPVVVYKGGEKVGLIMPVNPGTFKKLQTTWEKPKTAQPKLSDTKVDKPKTQKEKVAEVVKTGEKTIQEIAKETGILEPNVRRILGVGAKEGVFERIDKGVYTLSKDGIDTAWVETGDALESLPRLAKEGFKADMVFLDIPYNTPAIKGGNRGMNYNLISVDEFGKVLDAVKIISQKENTPIVHMFSQAPSGMKAMQKYNDLFLEKGFKPVGKGELQKTFKDGKLVTNVRGEVSKPEGIIVFSQSGKLDKELGVLNFKLVRPKGYQSEKPAEMLKAIIEMTTNEGDVVLDPFAGSGVTGAEAIKARRKAYLIEKDADVAKNITSPRVKSALEEVYKEGDKVGFGGKTMKIKSILKMEGENKYQLVDSNGKEIWTNKRGFSSGELGSLASPQGNKTIRKIIERQKTETVNDVQEVPKDFKISQRAKEILDRFGIPVGERTLSNRLLGVFKPLTEKVRVQALYDVTTVTHEAIHAIDHQDNFSADLIASTGRGAQIRNRLTDIYEELYPKAKRTHKLDIRIKEGLAVLFENYFYDPASIQAKYPDLVNAFIKPEGQYYNPKFTELLDAMNELVDDYAALSPEQKIGSRIRTGKEVVEEQTGFSKKQRLEYELFNRFEPLKRYGQEAGVAGTWNDPYIQAFNIMNKNSIIANWVNGKETPILMRDGNFKIEKGSVQDYVKLIEGKEDAFRSYLIARRVVSDNNKLNDLKNELRETQEIDEMDGEVDVLAMKNEIEKLRKTIERDDFSLQDATVVVEKYSDQFKEAETIYDDINRRLLEVSEQNDLIDAETANLYKNEPGYASFRRYIDEELTSVGTMKSSSKSKVTSFKERTGSQLDIVDPIYSQITAINEIMGKALENRLWNKVADLANKNPEISQRFEKIKSEPALDANGNISFPQEKQPDIIRIFRKGKREFYRAGPEFIAVSKQLRGKEFDAFVQMLRIPSSVFTRLTTSANPLFAAGNLSVDQFSALAQTKTGFKPVVDPAKSFYKYIKSDEGMNAYIAMGGKRQTLSAFYDLSPEQITNKMLGGKTKLEKTTGYIDSAIGVLEIPANISEIMTRYSEFSRAKDMGKTDSEAMFMAAEVTTPFQLQGNMGGRFGQEYIKSIPYFNSIIQVLYKYGRSAKNDPKRMASVTAGLFTVGLTMAIAMMKGSSDEQKRLLSEQPTRNLSRYLYFPSPNGKDLIKIRIPEQMGVFTGMGYLYTFEHYGGNEATFNDYLDVVSSTLPEQIQVWNPSKAIVSWLPQAIKPGVQTAFNVKTFPEMAPIVPFYMKNRKPSEQYNAYTSEVAKSVGQWLNISPAKTEFLVRNQLGAVGGALMGKMPGNPIYIQEKEYVMTGRSYNSFYDNRELVTQTYNEMLKDNPDKYTYDQKYDAKKDMQTYSSISDILTEIGKINKQKELPEEVKKTTYEVLIGLDGDKDITPTIYKLKDQVINLRQSMPK